MRGLASRALLGPVRTAPIVRRACVPGEVAMLGTACMLGTLAAMRVFTSHKDGNVDVAKRTACETK